MSYPPCTFVSNTAITKPAKRATPFPKDSLLNASGIMVSPNITRIAPPANTIDIDIIGGLAFDNTVLPIVVDSVPITMAADHKMSIYLLPSPADFMSLVEASPSAKFETKIATRKAIFIMPPEASVIPSAAFSGILSITDPMDKDLPEGGLISAVALLSALGLHFWRMFFLTFSLELHLHCRTKYPLK